MLGNFFFLFFSQKRQQKGQKLKDTVGKIKKNLSGELKRKKKEKRLPFVAYDTSKFNLFPLKKRKLVKGEILKKKGRRESKL